MEPDFRQGDQLIEPLHGVDLSQSEFTLFGFGIMNGEPDRRMILARPFDAVFYARRNENVVALGQNLDFGLAFETQPGRSGQDHNPFGPGLIVPKPWRARLAHRDDPLDPYMAGFGQAGDMLFAHVFGRRLKQIAGRS